MDRAKELYGKASSLGDESAINLLGAFQFNNVPGQRDNAV